MRLFACILFLWPFVCSSQQFEYTIPELPEKLNFATEEVPLERADIKQDLMRELIINTYGHSRTLQTAMRAVKYEPLIIRVLKEENVPSDFYYLAIIESELDPDAISYAGALGIWQLREETAKELGLIVTDHIDQRKDTELSTRAAAKYLKKAYDTFGSWTLAVAAYNRGIAGLKDALESQKVSSFYDLYMHPQTARYLYRVLAAKTVFESDKSYVINKEKFKNILEDEKHKTVTITQNIENLPEFAIQHGTTYKKLKELNPWMVNTDYRLVVPEGKELVVRIPE